MKNFLAYLLVFALGLSLTTIVLGQDHQRPMGPRHKMEMRQVPPTDSAHQFRGEMRGPREEMPMRPPQFAQFEVRERHEGGFSWGCGLWIVAGLFTTWLMFRNKEQVPVFKALIVTLFGWLSLIVWCIANIGKSVPNPFYKGKSDAPHKK